MIIYSELSHGKWWFSIVFCMFTRPGIRTKSPQHLQSCLEAHEICILAGFWGDQNPEDVENAQKIHGQIKENLCTEVNKSAYIYIHILYILYILYIYIYIYCIYIYTVYIYISSLSEKYLCTLNDICVVYPLWHNQKNPGGHIYSTVASNGIHPGGNMQWSSIWNASTTQDGAPPVVSGFINPMSIH